jgi:hypothetical protein
MHWLRASSAPWLLMSLGLLSTSCVGALGLGAVAVAAGAGALAYTCYDRVSVTVTDRLTGTKLCDAKVVFKQGSSETEATSCYQAALSKGKYTLRVERAGLEPFEEPIEVVRGENCGQTVQTMLVALDRVNQARPPQRVAPPPPAVAVPPVQPIGPVQPVTSPALLAPSAPATPGAPGAPAGAPTTSAAPVPAPPAPAPAPASSAAPAPPAASGNFPQ